MGRRWSKSFTLNFCPDVSLFTSFLCLATVSFIPCVLEVGGWIAPGVDDLPAHGLHADTGPAPVLGGEGQKAGGGGHGDQASLLKSSSHITEMYGQKPVVILGTFIKCGFV